ncbi:hypothetical protein T4C_10400 [Trichinella pseudospiralis]|uniref:Uncharacterized protein n=1 Tax=Trichinella pseudospiralis TaxID=6337 RepID=A0A0V1K178_TRIPS|nr:hypothetical protein T4C_10400 [Trichinella pseudospiralis]
MNNTPPIRLAGYWYTSVESISTLRGSNGPDEALRNNALRYFMNSRMKCCGAQLSYDWLVVGTAV